MIRELDTDFGDGWCEGQVLETGEVGIFPQVEHMDWNWRSCVSADAGTSVYEEIVTIFYGTKTSLSIPQYESARHTGLSKSDGNPAN